MSTLAKSCRDVRFRKRLTVTFGTGVPLTHSGFTMNVSSRGLAISSPFVHPVGTRLHLEAKLPQDEVARLEARVVWAQRRAPTLGIPNTLGVVLVGGDECWFRFIAGVAATEARRATGECDPPAEPGPVAKGPRRAPPPAVSPENRLDCRGPHARLPRLAIQLPMRLGLTGALTMTGTTLNVCATGLAVATAFVQAPGQRVFFELEVAPGSSARGEGVVVWAKRMSLRDRVPNSMGLRVSAVDEAWYRLVMSLSLGARADVRSPRPGERLAGAAI